MRAFTAICAAFSSLLALGACSSESVPAGADARQPQSVTGEVRGIVGRGIAHGAQAMSEGRHDTSGENPIVFEDKDIQSFNSVTREIRFNNIEPAKDLVPYREIAFELDGETLFTAVTAVMPTSSRIICDLVLYIEHENDYRYYLNDGYPLWAGQTEEGLANAAARAEGWNKFLDYLRSENKLIEYADTPPVDDPADDPDDSYVPGTPSTNIGDVELTRFTPRDSWEWADMEPNLLNVIRSEEELGTLIETDDYIPSGIDFDKYTLLLVRVYAPYGLHRIYYGLWEGDSGFDYRMRVEMNCACVISDEIFAVLAPAVPRTENVAFDIVITDGVTE